ncbi:MAG: 4-(cytidine 5'-diphospho)-2-C-methyl-D-erythritol kinase [Acholeplasmatales bacterium]|nr:4-(cytidine 5'-diphospho)-2-C-methyl-D-erythritol kinase [Acholeplasmatales bacterium]
MIQERAYAKINLGLEVGPLRSDGYHKMNTLMVPIDLYDELTFDFKEDGGILLIDNTNINIEDNFVYKAANLFLNELHIDKGIVITLKKNIPSEAGLGGGSADAAATLRGLNRLFRLDMSLDELAQMAKKLGSDMPYCIYQRLAYCSGRGENVSVIDMPYKHLDVAIIKPPYGLSTKEVYDGYSLGNINVHKEQFEGIKKALSKGDLKLLEQNIFNDLEESAFNIKPDLQLLALKIKAMGFVCGMSGSGTALFVFGDNHELHKMAQKIKYHRIYIGKLM